MKCPLCGAEVSKDDLFCESCGHNLIQDRPRPRRCLLRRRRSPKQCRFLTQRPLLTRRPLPGSLSLRR